MNGNREPSASDEIACLVLMFKAPGRSKRRLARTLGAAASGAAERLFECAVEDMREWSGPVCFAPAARDDYEWLQEHFGGDARALTVLQGEGNLGERINNVNRALWRQGQRRQILIGIDCPALTTAEIARAGRALESSDAVLGPAVDGGAVLIASRRLWPPLGDLPWSEPHLLEALTRLCRSQRWRVDLTSTLADVDTAEDLRAAGRALANDVRPARRALLAWIEANGEQLAAAAP